MSDPLLYEVGWNQDFVAGDADLWRCFDADSHAIVVHGHHCNDNLPTNQNPLSA
jgi:hypothetical protein